MVCWFTYVNIQLSHVDTLMKALQPSSPPILHPTALLIVLTSVHYLASRPYSELWRCVEHVSQLGYGPRSSVDLIMSEHKKVQGGNRFWRKAETGSDPFG